MKNDFKVLSSRIHVLTRPGMYIGSVDLTERSSYLYKDDKFVYDTYTFVPALIKIIDEILDNAVDVAIRTKFACDKIKVKITDDEVIISDNGEGIPVEIHADTGKYLPELAFTQMRTGTSFEADRKTIGSHGLGSVACNIFSTKFTATIDDGNKRFILKCKNNLSEISHTIKPSNTQGVTVKFKPDLARFGLTKIDDVHKMLIHQRLINLSVSYPQINFYFDSRKININAKKFIKMFSDGKEVSQESNNCIIGILPNEYDDFKYYTYVNGISMPDGGTHIDYIINQVVYGVKEKLQRKHKSIKPGDIKNKLQLVLFMRNFPNPKFNSQTKERLTNSQAEISKFIDFDIDLLIKQVLRNTEIVESIVEMFKIKEELKARKNLKTTTRKKVKTDKYISPIKENDILFLTEGLSAVGSISSILGRENYGYYAMKGVPLNTYSSNIQKIIANKEIKEIAQILNLDLSTNNNSEISFNKIAIATDADCVHEDTIIVTESGNKKIKDIIHGDKVKTHTGEYHVVTDIIESKKDNSILIELPNGGSIITTSLHKIPVLRNDKIESVYAKDITDTDLLVISKQDNE